MFKKLKTFFKSEFDCRKKSEADGTLPLSYTAKSDKNLTASINTEEQDVVLQFWGWAIWLRPDGTWSCEDTSGQ